MSIDDYLDDLLSGSSDSSKKAIMKLTRLIENLGIIMVKSTERMEDTINDMEVRLSRVESQIGGGTPRSPSSPISQPQQNTDGERSGPSMSGGNVPKLNIGGNSSPSSGPPSSGPPSSGPPNTSGSSIPSPNLSGGGSPPGSNPGSNPGGNPGGNPGSGSSSPMGNPFAGSSFANELANAASSLQKVDPEQLKKENGSPGGDPGGGPGGSQGGGPLGGPSSSMIQNARAGLKKINPDEIKKEKEQGQSSSGPPQMGFQSELKQKMSERSKRMKDKGQDEFAQQQQRQQQQQQQQQQATPKKSKKQMKESLQNELRSAFSRLLESDTQEE